MSDFDTKTSEKGEQGVIPIVQVNTLDSDHKNQGGAAVEETSPLGQQFGAFSVICLNLSMMIGTGVFSTPGSILIGTGSVGLSLVYWVIGALISWAGLAYYLELGSYFPNRAGAEVVYLEQAYKKPLYLFPAAFAASTVILSFSSSNCIVIASYIFKACAHTPTDWQSKGLAVAAYTVACLLILFSTKWSSRLTNLLAIVKTVLLVLVSITGLVVLGGHTRVQNPHKNFENAFAGSSSNGNALSTSLTRIIFSYAGWNNSHSLINEVRGGTKTLKWASPLALAIVFVLYFFANIAYFAAVPLEEIRNGGTLVAALFFEKVFGDVAGKTVLPIFVALSAFGNLLAVAIGQSRIIREVARQGVLPYAAFWTSVRPFNTPAAPLLLKWVLTVFVIVAIPTGDGFAFIVDLQSYPSQVFAFLNVVGVWLIRRHRLQANALVAENEYRAWNIALVFSLLVSAFLLIMPWVPPTKGIYGGDVSFLYCTYCIVGLAIIFICWAYWALWFKLLPKWQKFTWAEQITVLKNGELSKSFIRIYEEPSASSRIQERKASDASEDYDEKTSSVEGRSVPEHGTIPLVDRTVW
ncbi:high affinity methionine permease [Mrakia frigida]|uniref:high affinity methionine permease n=1 Tax=Mrakia frigida TaxID=29902 RepID=UPI003FCC19CB